MKFHALASIIAAALLALGCTPTPAPAPNTKSEDCSKVLALYNAHVVAKDKIDADKPTGGDELTAEADKYDADLAALAVKDDGVKTKKAAMVDANMKWTVGFKAYVAGLKKIDALKEPKDDDEAAQKKFHADRAAAKAESDAASTAVDKLQVTKAAVSDDFDKYCGLKTVATDAGK